MCDSFSHIFNVLLSVCIFQNECKRCHTEESDGDKGVWPSRGFLRPAFIRQQVLQNQAPILLIFPFLIHTDTNKSARNGLVSDSAVRLGLSVI